MIKKNVLLLTMVTVTACSSGSASPVAPTNTQVGNNQAVVLPTKITLQSVPMILDPAQVPPDPGLDNDKTIAGIDSNNNGIRDDVERWIAQTYPNSAKMRAATAQMSLAMSKEMSVDINNIAAVLVAEAESSRSIRCFQYSGSINKNNEQEQYKTFKYWMAKQSDTQARLKVHLDFDAKLSGRVFNSPKLTPADCDVDITVLPN